MAIKVKAIERKLKFEKGENAPFEYRYVMQADLYNKLSQTKVIQEASLRSGISKGAINAAWDAIGEVIKAWATEGHSVAVPGLGTMRFGLRSTSIADVNKVGTNLITSRRVIFTPSVDIKNELKKTSISITCIDRNGDIVKRVTSSDDADVEDPEDENPDGGGDTPTGGETKAKYLIRVVTPNADYGTVEGGGEYEEGETVNLLAEPKSGYKFVSWNDGNTSASRFVQVTEAKTYTATFAVKTSTGEDDDFTPPQV